MILCLRLVLAEFLLLAAADLDDARVFLEAIVIIVSSVFVEFGVVLAFILEPDRVFLEATVNIVFSVQLESGVREANLLVLVLLEAVVIPLSSVRAELGVLCTVLATEEIAFVREWHIFPDGVDDLLFSD